LPREELNIAKIEFSLLKRRKTEAELSVGKITSDASILTLREADRKLGLLKRVSRVDSNPLQIGENHTTFNLYLI